MHDDRSSANLGQLHLSVQNSWYVSAGIFKLVLDFVQSNQSYDFNLKKDLQWHHLLRFSDEKLKKAISKPGHTKKNKVNFMECVARARLWDSPIGTRIPMDTAQFERLNEAFDREERGDNLPSINIDKEYPVYLHLRDILTVAKLIGDSGHPDAERILLLMKENLPQMNRNVTIEQGVDVDWKEKEAGFKFVMHDSFDPVRLASKRWDALHRGVLVTLIRQSMAEHFTAFINFDETPIEITEVSESITQASSRVDAYIRQKQAGIKKIQGHSNTLT